MHKKINIFLYLTFTSISSLHREERNFSQLGIPLFPCSKIIYKFKRDQGGFWFLVHPPSTWANTWHSHISIHCKTINPHRSPHILPCSRAHGLFRCYSGVLGKSSAWNVGNCAYAPRHLATFRCCSARCATEATLGGFLWIICRDTRTQISSGLLPSVCDWGKCSVFSTISDPTLRLGAIFLRFSNLSGVFYYYSLPRFALDSTGKDAIRNLLPYQLSSLPLWIFFHQPRDLHQF